MGCLFGLGREERTEIVRRSVLEQIFKEMMIMRRRLDDIECCVSNIGSEPIKVEDNKLIDLPDHLRKTYLAVAFKGECDAAKVANLTGRCRAIESNYLNQLSRMGWLNRRRIAKTVHFRTKTTNNVRKDYLNDLEN
jgi:hypothetical protein